MLSSNSSQSQTDSLQINVTIEVDLQIDSISEEVLWFGTIIIKYCINSLLAVCAMTCNTINAIVFCRLGVSNGINQNFLLLSVSDLLYGLIRTIVNGSLIANKLEIWMSPLAPASFFKFGEVFTKIPYFGSIIFTTVIALIRCYSVVMPLKVKVILSPRRQLVLILLPFCLFFGFCMNVIACLRLKWWVNSRTKVSQLMMYPCPDFSERQRLLDFSRTLLLCSAYTTVVVCLLVLLVALKQSSRFKKSSNSCGNQRDAQVVKTVVLVSVIFVICNMPAIMVPLMRQMWPEFKLRGNLGRSYQLALMYVETNALVNACANIFVFYSSSSLYRQAFRKIFFEEKC